MCFYLLSYNNYIFGELFIDNEKNLGIYQDSSVIRQIIKNKTENFHSPFCEPLLNEVVKKHSIKYLKTSININNKISQHKILEIIFYNKSCFDFKVSQNYILYMKTIKKIFQKIIEDYGKMGEIIPVKFWNKVI